MKNEIKPKSIQKRGTSNVLDCSEDDIILEHSDTSDSIDYIDGLFRVLGLWVAAVSF